LLDFESSEGTKLLQYVDELLVAGKTEGQVKDGTVKLFNFLGTKELKVSKAKLPFAESEVKHLGHWQSQGKKKLDPDRISGILSMHPPRSKREIRHVLGLLGYCRQWIEGSSEKVKFLYEKLTTNSLKWTLEDDQLFNRIKRSLVEAPVLSLPDLNKPFHLFVNVSNQPAYGVLAQDWAGSKKPRGYFCKLLDLVSRGWPTCLQALVATALLIGETKKITFSGKVVV